MQSGLSSDFIILFCDFTSVNPKVSLTVMCDIYAYLPDYMINTMLIVIMQSTSDKLFSTKKMTMYRTLDTNEEIISLHCIQIPEDRASVFCGS